MNFLEVVTEEDNKPKGRCIGCNEPVTSFYRHTLLCKSCYKRQLRKDHFDVFTRCFGCGGLIKSGYKGTWLCKQCYRNTGRV